LAQVKTTKQEKVDELPRSLPGAAWQPMNERMTAGVFFPLFVVVVSTDERRRAIYYLPADLQSPEMFERRQPLSPKARRAGWTGYKLRLDISGGHKPVRVG
jgi:type II restriction enzyme